MKAFGALLLVLSIGAVQVQGQEPRLPAPAGDTLRKRGADSAGPRAVCRRQLPRERSGLADRRRARAGHCEPRHARIDSRARSPPAIWSRPSNGLDRARHRCSSRAPASRSRCVPRRRNARLRHVAVSPRARGRRPLGCGRRGRDRSCGDARAGRASCAKHSRRTASCSSRSARPPPSRSPMRGARRLSSEARRGRTADRSRLRRHRRSPRGCRRISPRGRHAGRVAQATSLTSSRREEIESAMVQHLYSLRANDEARAARTARSSSEHPDSLETATCVHHALPARRARGALCRRRKARPRDHGRRDRRAPTLSDRQGAARLLAEYLVSIGQPTKALGVYSALYKMTLDARRPRRCALADGDRVASRAAIPRARSKSCSRCCD